MNRLELSARCTVQEGKLAAFKDVAAEFIRQTKQKDTRTLRFDWFLSADEVESEIREEYLDAQGFIEHKTHTAEITQRLFPELAKDHRVSFFGEPPAMLVQRVEQTPMGRTVKWFRFLQGLAAEPTSYTGSDVKPGLEMSAHMTIRPDRLDGFKQQAAEMLRLTREKDTRTLRYDWFVSVDGDECEVRESYLDDQGLVEHNANVAQARDALFEQFADHHFMTAYGTPTQMLLELVEATHMKDNFKWFLPLGGLSDGVPAAQPREAQPARLV